ncbi:MULTISPECIES: aldehyde dehydrogenase family protein [Cupriavidus]|uniref:Aldehyde dehydrogenase n=2 Tax=Cupriavidus TaxID=106589 RepID=A0A142JIK9_9BURK|nr:MULTISPECIES: aldehyde dehydrogenase family protein [Cupriavidus]AMR77921.1 aldehyde dehydrogenase [Cupriavidus nantongensis]CAG9179744.1 Hydroxyisobutyraldehyde dehydrogenase [Cupriavidus laharis]
MSFPIPADTTSFIDGDFVSPGAATTLPIINPADEQVVSLLHEADAGEVERAVAAARDAFLHGPWPRMAPAARREVFARIIDLVGRNLDELAWLETANTGQTLHYARQYQLPRILGSFRFYAEWLGQATELATQDGEATLRYVLREPLGVVALISPSNAPTALASTKIAAALAFGNTCVVKTSEQTPLALARLMALLTEAGVPPGVVNLVNGRGHVTGDALVRHPDVRGISFTGGTATARRIAAIAGEGLKRVDLELGGKSANIIMPSADLERAVDAALLAIFTNNGQQCFAGSRIVLHRDIADAFIDRFVARTERIRVGHPLEPSSDNGPLAFRASYERVQSYVDIARADGCKLLAGGTRAPGFERGYYFRPTAVLAPSNAARVCQEEVFGPFAALLVVDSLDEAITVANDSRYGLVSYLWTGELSEAMDGTRRIQAGNVLVNTPMLSLDPRLPFGGYKESGVGREGALPSRHFYTEEKTVTVALTPPALSRLGV